MRESGQRRGGWLGPALWFLPLLGFYVWLIVADAESAFRKDEITYHTYAANLLSGHYAPPGTEFLWVGPGYPLLLTPFVASSDPASADPFLPARLCNAVLLYLAVLLMHRTVRQHASERTAVVTAIAFGMYWPMFDWIEFMATEPLTVFLLAAALCSVSGHFRSGGRSPGHLLATAVLLGWLALTKVLFGYVLLAALVLAAATWVVRRTTLWARTTVLAALALVVCSPYLIYTQAVTGKFFYFGTSGGMQAYWMTSPHDAERGDWINYILTARDDATIRNPVIRNHGALFADALGYDGFYEEEPWHTMVRRLGVRQDQMFKARAWQNVVDHPAKYARNWLDNLSRMWTDSPYSYREQDHFWQFGLPNTLVLVFLFRAIRRILQRPRARGGIPGPPGGRAVAAFGLLYLGAASLLCAQQRQFYVMAPLLFWGISLGFRTGERLGEIDHPVRRSLHPATPA